MRSIIIATCVFVCLIAGSGLSLLYSFIFSLPICFMSFGKRTKKPKESDLIIVGYGGAGASAALQAAETAAELEKENYRILVLERFDGGGATWRSGGVYYAGGGTNQQKYTGVEDTVENMYTYLKGELGDSVSDELLKVFSNNSAKDIAWLNGYGVPINQANHIAKCYQKKASMPPADYTLYYSGSEKAAPFVNQAKPAQRGHMPSGPRSAVGGGFHIFEALNRAIESSTNIEVRFLTSAKSLVKETNDGGIRGVRVLTIEDAPLIVRMVYVTAYTVDSIATIPFKPYDSFMRKLIRFLDYLYGLEYETLATDGVILCAGGFGRNNEMVKDIMPEYDGLFSLAPLGSDGSGIMMGVQAGGDTSFMRSGASWKFLYPPFAFTKGILVNANGARIINEDVYGARLGKATIEENNGISWFIIDQQVYEEAREELRTDKSIPFAPKLQGYLNLYLNREKAFTVSELAKKCDIRNIQGLQNTLEKYNKDCEEEIDKQFGKAKECLQPLRTPPFYAINYCAKSNYWFTPWLTMGGLKVDETSGLVLNKDSGCVVPRLYAAGRNAAGLPSKSYVSGLSIADCVFSGRRAGMHAVKHGKHS